MKVTKLIVTTYTCDRCKTSSEDRTTINKDYTFGLDLCHECARHFDKLYQDSQEELKNKFLSIQPIKEVRTRKDSKKS